MAANLAKVPAMSLVADTIKGFVRKQRDKSQQQNAHSSQVVRSEVQAVAIGIRPIALLVACRWQRARRGGL